jgi:hypothetical protein
MTGSLRRFALVPVIVVAAIAVFLIYDQVKGDDRQIDASYDPVISPANFTNGARLTNPYYSFEPGKKYIYEGRSEEGTERIELQLLETSKQVMGINCAVINDKSFVNGKLVENTNDWFAQDNDGTIWYFGEAVDFLNEDGSIKNHEGSWEAGVDGAKPGIFMLARPQPGKSYRQEYYFNHAEGQARVEEVGLTMQTVVGSANNVIKIKEWDELEDDSEEFKYYAPGIGLIKVVHEAEDEEIQLKGIQ